MVFFFFEYLIPGMVLICRKYGSWSHLKVKLYQLFIEHIKMNNRMMKKKVYFKKKKLKLPIHAILVKGYH